MCVCSEKSTSMEFNIFYMIKFHANDDIKKVSYLLCNAIIKFPFLKFPLIEHFF